MKHLSFLSPALLVLALAGPVRAQAPAAAVGPLQPVQTIALGPHAAFGGAVQLANKNTVVLLTDADSYAVKAKCLAPDGSTVWEAELARYQHMEVDGFSVFSPFSNVAIGQNAKQDKARLEQRVKTLLQPMNVYTNGNQLLTVEYISREAVKHQPKGGTLLEGQIYVQRLDETGQLVKAKFDPRADPESRKTKDELLGRYADATGDVVIFGEYAEGDLPEADMRPDLTGYFARRYGPDGKVLAQTQLQYTAAFREGKRAGVREAAETAAEGRLIDALVGKDASEATRNAFRAKFVNRELAGREVEIEVEDAGSQMPFELPGMAPWP